jgi:hypothetical protein
VTLPECSLGSRNQGEFLCPSCRAEVCDESAGNLILVVRVSFYALRVGRRFVTVLNVVVINPHTGEGFYALRVGRRFVTQHQTHRSRRDSFLCPSCRAEVCDGYRFLGALTWEFSTDRADLCMGQPDDLVLRAPDRLQGCDLRFLDALTEAFGGCRNCPCTGDGPLALPRRSGILPCVDGWVRAALVHCGEGRTPGRTSAIRRGRVGRPRSREEFRNRLE